MSETLQQVDPTHVLWRGRKLVYFGGCDYLRLAWHPRVRRALTTGVGTHGLNVGASRMTTGNHPLYAKVERALARFFAAPSATLVSSGYVTNLVVAQAFSGEFTHALLDERAHASLLDAACLMRCVVRRFAHRDAADLRRELAALPANSRAIVMTDGVFPTDGALAPLAEYDAVIPPEAWLLVDDAHGAGVLGRHGRGSLELAGLRRPRTIQTLTLSKALGTYGGAILGGLEVRKRILRHSALFTGNTPLPPPLAGAVLAALRLVRGTTSPRVRLGRNLATFNQLLRRHSVAAEVGPMPLLKMTPVNARAAADLKRRLLAAGIHPPLIRYPGGEVGGFFRFALSSAHTATQLRRLATVLAGV